LSYGSEGKKAIEEKKAQREERRCDVVQMKEMGKKEGRKGNVRSRKNGRQSTLS
jgi:hypothetical protein